MTPLSALLTVLRSRPVVFASRVVLYSALAWYIGRFFITSYDEVRTKIVGIDAGWMTVSILVSTGAPVLAALGWARRDPFPVHLAGFSSNLPSAIGCFSPPSGFSDN